MKKNKLKNTLILFDAKGFSIPLIVGIIALVLVIGGGAYFLVAQQSSINKENDAAKEQEGDRGVGKEDSAMEKQSDAAVEKEEVMIKYSGEIIAGKSALLLDFNKADYDTALKTDKLVVLYFYANWCPICRAEVENALYPFFNELIADKVIGFRVNYNDNQTDNDEKNLAREFGVAYQHTKVFLKDDQRVLKSPESWNKSRYSQEVNKYLN